MMTDDDKQNILFKYCNFLNRLDPNAFWKLTIMNRIRSDYEIEHNILLPSADDELEKYRKEVNDMLLEKMTASSPYEVNHYITCSVKKNNLDDARLYFERLRNTLSILFQRLRSSIKPLNEVDRLKVYHDFFRPDELEEWHYEPNQCTNLGNSFKNFIAPYTFTPMHTHFEFGKRFGRGLIVNELPNFLKDDFFKKLCDVKVNFAFSIDIIPIPRNEAVDIGYQAEMNVSSKISSFEQRQNKNNKYLNSIPSNLRNEQKVVDEFMEDVTERDQNLYMCDFNMIHTANTLKELDNDTDAITEIGREYFLKFQTAYLKTRQIDCLKSALPFGFNYTKGDPLPLMTEGLASFVPFCSQEVIHDKGIFFGTNRISGNLIKIDRTEFNNGNCWITGDSGGGKSFEIKTQIALLRLLGSASDNADVIIIDPDQEYCHLTKELGGSIATISTTSKTHINPFDINIEYGNDDVDHGDPIRAKSTFILSMLEQILIDEGGIDLTTKGIIDKAVREIYKPLEQKSFKGEMPTMKDFSETLRSMNDEVAEKLAKKLEIFTNGSLDLFAHHSNVDINSSMLCYDIHGLDSQLENLALIIILDSILNRISANRKKGRTTYIIIDEIYLLFDNPYSLNFLEKLWLRIRKYNGFATAIIQNVYKLENNDKAMSMLSNSELTIMLKQSERDKNVLAVLYDIPESQLEDLKNADQGTGLLRVGKHIIAFENLYPDNTELYKLMTTKPKDQFMKDVG